MLPIVYGHYSKEFLNKLRTNSRIKHMQIWNNHSVESIGSFLYHFDLENLNVTPLIKPNDNVFPVLKSEPLPCKFPCIVKLFSKKSALTNWMFMKPNVGTTTHLFSSRINQCNVLYTYIAIPLVQPDDLLQTCRFPCLRLLQGFQWYQFIGNIIRK